MDTLPAAGEPLTHGSARRASHGNPVPGGTPIQQTDNRRWTTPVPELRLEFRSTFANTLGAMTATPLPIADRCRILDCVVRLFPAFPAPRNLEGPVPGPGSGRLGSSPALRTAARAGLTQKDRALLSRWASARDVPEAHGALHPGIPIQGGVLAPRTESRRWHPETTRRPRRPLSLSD